MSDQSNNNESENMDNTPVYNDMINPPSWSVEPEQLEGLIELIDNMTNSIQNESNVEDFSEILSDVDSNDNLDNSNNDLEGLETLFQDFDIQEDSDVFEDTVFQDIHVEIPTVQSEENGGATAPPAHQEDGENEVEEHESGTYEENSEAETQEVQPIVNDTTVDPGEEEELSDSDVSDINEYPIIDDCCVCYKPCTGKNVVNTPCGHIYCRDCFFRWIRVRPTCPMCRRDFTSIAAMSNDEISEDVHNITQLYRRTIIENDKLMYDNKLLDRRIKKKERKNNDLSVESLSLITRLVSAREQLDYTKGYHNAIKDKARMELVEKLNIDVRPNNYLYECNQPPYNNLSFNKGYRLGIYEFDYCMSGFTDYKDKKSEYFIPKWTKKFGRIHDKKLAASPQENEK